MAERRKRRLTSSKHSSGHEQEEESTDLNLSRRPSETILPLKRIKSDGQNDETENQVTPQYSGYSGSQGNAFHAMDLDSNKNFSNSEDSESQGQNVEPMDLDEHRKQSGPRDDTTEKDNYLLNINVDEDSQESYEEESRKAGDENRNFAENVVCCSVSMGPSAAKQQKKQKNKAKKQGEINEVSEDPQELVLKNACALLNSGGGVLVIKIADFQSLAEDSVDTFWKTIEPGLSALITSSLTYDEVFDRFEFSDEVLLFIRAPQHFCTLKYNLFLPSDVSASEASYENTLKLLEKQPSKRGKKKEPYPIGVPLNGLRKVPKTLRCNQSLGFQESKQVQFKCWTSGTYLTNHSQRQSVERWISAFANGSGGVILLGVTNDGCVLGQKLSAEEKNSREDIEERISSLFNKMVCDFTLERKTHWDMEFVPVVGSESNVVIVIYVAGMASCGGVFTNCPKSFELKFCEDGNKVPIQLDFKGWKERMLSRMGLQSSGKAMDTVVAKFHRLRVSKGYLLTVKDDAQKIRDAFFHVRDGIPVMPKGFELGLPEKVKEIIKEIQKKVSGRRTRGLLVASRSWLGNVGGTPVDDVICDLLLVSRNLRGLHLLTLYNADEDDDGMFLKYSRDVAQKIKVSLAKDGACCEKVYVVPHIVPCSGETKQTIQALNLKNDKWYPNSYDLTSRKVLNEVLKSLVTILATVPSTLSSKLGVSIMNLLTKEQFQLLYEQIEVNRELWIKGPAGTGKTLVAVEFMRELKRRENLASKEILCVCENAGIKKQISDSNVCHVVSRQVFEKEQFPEVKHVVMDEAHNYEVSRKFRLSSSSKDVLFQKARRLVRQRDPSLPGYLWIFTDKCQTNHTFPSGLPPETLQKPCFRLKKVIRNSKRIFEHAKRYLTEENVGDTIEMGHDYAGEEVQLIRYRASGETSQVDKVNEVIKNLFDDGFRNGDIAVLFKTNDCIPEVGVNVTFVSAEQNNSDDLVVSTVLKYSGLERPVVVLVDIEDMIPWGRMRDPFIYCAVTRAMVKLVIIRRQ